ncbi:MAG: HAMP domain-containing sensor histidine kinase, partial [Alphaproteobacteria bacterium]
MLLTVAFVMLAEILIFVPSVARYRADFLLVRLKEAQIASLAQLATNEDISPDLQAELLKNAGVYNVVLLRDQVRQLVLSSPVPSPITATFDLRDAGPFQLIADAAAALWQSENQVIRVIGNPVQDGGLLIEVTMQSAPLRAALLDYSLRILALSALISVVTAVLLFLAVQRLMVLPIRRVVRNMQTYADAPEDARSVIVPNASITELRVAEEAMMAMQTQLTQALRQKERLAQLGGAVAKISHDLRNTLTTAQLFADRLESSADPTVARFAPKLVNSISRAVNLCESTLAFGKAEESPPRLTRFALRPMIDELSEEEGLILQGKVTLLNNVPVGLVIRADAEQLHRVLTNLVRNACQAIAATGQAGIVELSGGESDSEWWIRVSDTGPGLPPKAREHLFAAFQGGARRGGTGLGLAIAAELVRGHGGKLM